jgi:thiol:disulfide interchange protein DsbD
LPAKRRASPTLHEPARALACALLAFLASGAVRGTAAAPPEILEAERAFALSAQGLDPQTLSVRFEIADGYYLYRDKLNFSVSPGNLAAPIAPPGKIKEDQFFGKVETYRGRLQMELTLDAPRPGSAVTLVVESQGCADVGVCYPVQRQTLAVPLPRPGERPAPLVEAAPRRKSWFN